MSNVFHEIHHEEHTQDTLDDEQYLKDYFESCISQNTLHHAYLFLGSPFSKKDLFLSWFFLRQPHVECIVLGSTKTDFHTHTEEQDTEIFSQETIGIEDVRICLERIRTSSFEQGIRIVAIENAEKLTREASNALLKSLEEPHSDIIFFIQAKHEYLLLPTLVSRCHVIRFLPPSFEKINKRNSESSLLVKKLLFDSPLWEQLLGFEKIQHTDFSLCELVLHDALVNKSHDAQKVVKYYERLIQLYLFQNNTRNSNYQSDILCLQS